MRPRALLLDEPLAALDAPRKAEILPYLERLRDETRIPILYVSHSIEEVTRLADRMIVLDGGRIIAQGSVFDVTARLDLATFKSLAPGSILEARITAQDEAHKLTELALGAETLVVPMYSRGIGETVRIRIEAQDVMLALKRPDQISANNVLAARIEDISESGGHADIRLDTGGVHVLARITTRSRARLGLTPGMNVFAVVKSVTVGGRGDGA
jgi:molybdate transport system ATP-binding protein